MVTKINGREYNFSDDYWIQGLVDEGHLEKRKDGYWWTDYNLRCLIRGAKHIRRYARYSSYRCFVGAWKFLKDIYRTTVLPFF